MAFCLFASKLFSMKRLSSLALCLVTILILQSCKKNQTGQSAPTRKIQYVLYTNEDFLDNSGIIHFTLLMKDNGRVLWDSLLAPMQIKDIPDASHKIVVEKPVPDNNNSDLVVGFLYEIENVGYSWSLDTCRANESFKIVEFPFQ